MKKKIVIASTNAGKIKELKEMLEPKGYEVSSMLEYPDIPEIEETGTTFEDNAIIKAKTVFDYLHIDTIADDSGLEIDAFNGEPGVYSARYLGHDTPYSEKNQIILERMNGNENRGCRYVCAIAWCSSDHDPIVFKGSVECKIAYEPKGSNGFGYDPIIFYEPMGKTMAELTDEEKNAISHRGIALRKLQEYLEDNA